MATVAAVVAVMVVMTVHLHSCQAIMNTNSLIVVLIDGYRWDYTAIHGAETGLPGFQHFKTFGTSAKYLNPVYPANSFPNWHTISTGLYSEQHGIVGNLFYDPERKAVFALDNRNTTADPEFWKDAEPIWITATKHGLETALFQWSRCDVSWRGGSDQPKHCEAFKLDPTGNTAMLSRRLSRAVDMIHNDGYRLVMVYEGSVDTWGHNQGPLSPEVKAAVAGVDEALQGLWRHLQDKGMMDTTNVVLVSDHGMTAVRDGNLQVVDVSHCLQGDEVQVAVNQGSYLTLHPTPGRGEKVVERLRSCAGVKDKVNVFLKKELPTRYHYKAHRLIPEVVVIAKKGYTMALSEMPGVKVLASDTSSYFGNHGFDDTLGQHPDMRGVLYAAGPSFVKGGTAGLVQQVDVYGLLCHALLLPCHAHNGTLANIAPFLASPTNYTEGLYDGTSTFAASLVLFLASVAVLGIGGIGRRLWQGATQHMGSRL